MSIRIVLNPLEYNPIYKHVRKYLCNEDIRYLLIRGGSSAGKTYGGVQALTNTMLEDNSRSMMMRKIGADLKDSIYEDVRSTASKYNGYWRIQDKVIHGRRNEYFRFRGLDAAGKLKGISNYKRVYLNEVDSFYYSDFAEIRRRLRGQDGQQIIADWNPEDGQHWLKREILNKQSWHQLPNHIEGKKYSELFCNGTDEENSYVRINSEGNLVEIKTTYRDNYWIVGHPVSGYGFYDKHAIAEFERMKEEDPDDYNVYGNGNWGVRTERLIFKRFKEVDEIPKHFKQIPSGLDFGFSPDPVALVDIYIGNHQGRNVLLLDERIYKTGLIIPRINDDQPSLQDELEKIKYPKEHMIVADYDKTDVTTLRALGYNVQLAVKPPRLYHERSKSNERI